MVKALRDPVVRAEWRARADAAAGTALVDQTAAAGRQGAAVAVAGLGEPDRRDFDYATVPDWVLFPYVDATRSYGEGTARTCLHQPDPLRPQPVFAALWRPGLVVCAWCIGLLELPPGSEADRTCDRCGRVTAGPASGDGIHQQAITGPLTLLLGTCGPCCRAEGWPLGGGHDG